jgi:two-component system LytT family sensor kinase
LAGTAKQLIMMMKPVLITLLFSMAAALCAAQIQWGQDTALLAGKTWENYSTTYIGKEDDAGNALPVLVTAIPYNGIYSRADEVGSPFSMSYSGSMYSYRSYLSKNTQKLYTYDSAEVYFLTPGIHPSNAAQYQYRVLLNGKTVIKPWGGITGFTDDAFQLNNFNKHMGYLGGYKTTWNNFIVVELRKKHADTTAFASALVYWQQSTPRLLNIYTAASLGQLFKLIKQAYNPYTPTINSSDLDAWLKDYTPAQLDPTTHLPKKLMLQPGENNVVFYLTTGIYKKEAIEYQLLKNNQVVTPWQPNDADNSFIWLKNLAHGNYLLQVRYRAQRHNVLQYPIVVKPAWYQTTAFAVALAGLAVLLAGTALLWYRLVRQKRAARQQQANISRLSLELKAVQAQLNPHFIFNALSSIQGLVNSNHTQDASNYLAEFGALLRSTLTSSGQNFIVLQQEVQMLDVYLKLERLRFGFTYSITTGQGINVYETEVPLLLLQPLIENAVKHGVAGLQAQGIITIQFTQQGNDMVALITDNGPGYHPQTPAQGYGLKLTAERIALLNQVLAPRSIALTVNPGNTTGTTIQVLFKNWLL